MTNKEFEKKSAEKAKEVEEKLKEQNEEKTDDIEQTKKKQMISNKQRKIFKIH
ncbi:glycopeptide resistance-associated protein GraF [Staphylococcus epidermidis]|uniref:glycopeptide resistance-associated protein GraF n=1 Tax=Staphylococcus epidermidis TaxID=1282 RepID=UPI001F38BD13|nr:glycopeptide resistance-associated protein GraF [Staphylococcus epidermidis]